MSHPRCGRCGGMGATEESELRARLAATEECVCLTTIGCGECLLCETTAKLAATEKERDEARVAIHNALPNEYPDGKLLDLLPRLRAERDALKAHLATLSGLLRDITENIRTTPHMGGEISNPSIRDRKLMCEQLVAAQALSGDSSAWLRAYGMKVAEAVRLRASRCSPCCEVECFSYSGNEAAVLALDLAALVDSVKP